MIWTIFASWRHQPSYVLIQRVSKIARVLKYFLFGNEGYYTLFRAMQLQELCRSPHSASSPTFLFPYMLCMVKTMYFVCLRILKFPKKQSSFIDSFPTMPIVVCFPRMLPPTPVSTHEIWILPGALARRCTKATVQEPFPKQ